MHDVGDHISTWGCATSHVELGDEASNALSVHYHNIIS